MVSKNKKIRVLQYNVIYSISISDLYQWYIHEMNLDCNCHITERDRQNQFGYEFNNKFKELKEKPVKGISKQMSNYDINFLDLTIDDSIDEMSRLVSAYLNIFMLREILNANGA